MVNFINEALPCQKKPQKVKSDNVTLLEFLQSLTPHQIKTALFRATRDKKHLQLKTKENSEDWIIREQLLLSGLLCAYYFVPFFNYNILFHSSKF